MVASATCLNTHVAPKGVIAKKDMATFNGLKACNGAGSRRSVLSAAAPSVRARASRASTVTIEARKVAVLGAAGGIGQPLSLLMKMNEQVTELSLYDIANVKGVAADLSHVNTKAQVGKFDGEIVEATVGVGFH